jgi:hypothetical protein
MLVIFQNTDRKNLIILNRIFSRNLKKHFSNQTTTALNLPEKTRSKFSQKSTSYFLLQLIRLRSYQY